MKIHEFTPGPWRIDPTTRLGEFPIAAGNSVSSCKWIAKTDDPANARAIAAIPELVKALEWIEHAAGPLNAHSIRDVAREALAKLEG